MVQPGGSQSYLAFFRKQEQATIPLLPSGFHLFLGQLLEAEPVQRTGQFVLRTIRYEYRISPDASISSEALVRFEYVSKKTHPEFSHCRNHVQLHRDYHATRPDFSPSKFHIPTGWVTMEAVIRFLIADLGVRPLRKNWEPVLSESEEQFREWTSREVS